MLGEILTVLSHDFGSMTDNFDINNTNGHVEIGYDIAEMKGINPA